MTRNQSNVLISLQASRQFSNDDRREISSHLKFLECVSAVPPCETQTTNFVSLGLDQLVRLFKLLRRRYSTQLALCKLWHRADRDEPLQKRVLCENETSASLGFPIAWFRRANLKCR